MGNANSINLIPKSIENSPEFAGLYGTLRRLAYGSFILLIAAGLLVVGLFAYLSARQQSLLLQKEGLTIIINQSSILEGLLLTAKQRIAVIDKIEASQKNLSAFFELVNGMVSAGDLTELSLDETGKAIMTVHVNFIGDAVTLVDTLLTSAKANALTKPELASFTIAKEGGFDISVSFVPKM